MSFVFRPAQGNPSPSFALVMATGILAVAARQQGLDTLAMLLFECAVLAWVLLSLLSLWRLARHRGDVAQDLASLQRAPAFFTAVAGTGVLASGLLVLDGGFAWAAVLALLALVLWTVLTYGVFRRGDHQRGQAAAGAGHRGRLAARRGGPASRWR
jgi:tellurite resistance protein TehA-like permease